MARERKGIAGPKEAASRFGWSPNTYSSNENGNAPFSFKAAQKYAAAFGVRAEWLYSGEGEMRPAPPARRAPKEVSIISWVNAGALAEVAPEEFDEAEKLIFADLPEGDYFATIVRGGSMNRVSPEGSTIIVRTDDPDLHPGKMYLMSRRGEATFKRYFESPRRLEPYSTEANHPTYFMDEEDGWLVVGRVYRTMLDLV